MKNKEMMKQKIADSMKCAFPECTILKTYLYINGVNKITEKKTET